MSERASSGRAALSREFSEFLVEFSVALHKFAMYPSGHPSLGPTAGAVVSRLAPLLADREVVAFGVARRQLIIEGSATNPAQPVLRRLAESLHRHHLGAVSVARGVTVAQMAAAFATLAVDPEQHGAIGLAAPGARPDWPHLHLHPLSFDGLVLAGARESGPGADADLWIGLARAALSGDAERDPAAAGGEPSSTEPTVLASAIDAHPHEQAYDQIIIGYLLQIARELKERGGAEAEALKRRTARLLRALRPETLRRLVAMGGNVAQRHEFVLDAAQGMAVDAVIDIVRAAADASGQTISHGLSRMLSKLAAHAEYGDEPVRPLADVALREQVGRLLTGWELVDPNPAGYSTFLQHLATRTRDGVLNEPSPHAAVDPVRIVQLGLDVGESGPIVERAVRQAIAQGFTADLLALFDSPPPAAGAALTAVRTQVFRPDALAALLSQVPIDWDSVDRLLPAVGLAGQDVCLDALATVDDRAVRRKLLDRLIQAPRAIVPRIVARLDDPRWFVQRNMLVLLQRLAPVPDRLPLARLVQHPDVRVRHEAIRLQLLVPAERVQAVRAALADGHPRLVHSGLAAIQGECPAVLAPAVGSVLTDPAQPMDLRVLAAQALERCRDRAALPALLSVVNGGRTLLGRPRLADPSPVVVAALRSLAGGWRADSTAAAWLRLAAASTHDAVRRAVQGGTS